MPTEWRPELRVIAAREAVGDLASAGLTRNEIARAVNVSPQAIQSLETKGQASPDVADRLASLNVAVQIGRGQGWDGNRIATWLRARGPNGIAPLDLFAQAPEKVLEQLWRYTSASGSDTPSLGLTPRSRRPSRRPTPRPLPGRSIRSDTVLGRRHTWTLGPEVGRGGTSIVREATSDNGRRGVVKIFSAHRFPDSDEARKRFSREAAHLSTITHANVVSVLDTGDIDGTAVLVLERAECSVYDLLTHGPIPLALTVDFLSQALAGLHALHNRGLVHRDISPKNLLVFPGDRLAVADLGTVRHYDDTTITGQIAMGSLLYISSEQFRDPHNATPQDDIFSLGQVAYHMVTGWPPHGNPEPLTMACPDVPARLVDAIEAMRAYRSDHRPETAEDAAIGVLMDGQLALSVALRSAACGDPTDALRAMRQAYVEKLADDHLMRELHRKARTSRNEDAAATCQKWLSAWTGSEPSDSRHEEVARGTTENSWQPLGRLDRLAERGRSGTAADVDSLMSELADANLATTKIVDYAIGLVDDREGIRRLDYYLFNGSQRQRNYAALYFKRRGDEARLRRAVNFGAIDNTQAFSR